jgi:hypothetical protein
MLGAHKYGHRILAEYVYLSHIPSARELINLMGEEQKFTLKYSFHTTHFLKNGLPLLYQTKFLNYPKKPLRDRKAAVLSGRFEQIYFVIIIDW